jgi:hypothetical protein
MNKIKNIVIATIFLSTLLRFPLILPALRSFNEEGSMSKDAEQVLGQADTSEPVETEDIITESISPETPQEPENLTKEQLPSATAQWDNHLDALKEKDQYWNQNSNIPTNDWKEKAIELAKEALDKDKNSADALKSAFFNAITEKIKIEEGEFTASTYALIKEFDDAIDTYATSLKASEETAQEPEQKEEEIQPEPIVEPAVTPIEVETTPSSVEEAPTQPVSDSAAAPAAGARDVSQDWQDHLETIAITGSNDAANKSMLFKAYDLAKELLSQGYTGESLLSGLIYVLRQHNNNPHLLPINEMQALEAFSAETGIVIPYNQQMQAQQQYTAEMKKQAEQQKIAKKQKETALRTTATVQQAIKQANISESKMQELNRLLQEKLAAEEAARIAQQKETDAKIASLQQELASVHKVKTKETPPAGQGIIGKAIGAVKGAASAATTWWYGEESQEQKDIEALDKTRFAKLQEILTAKKLMPEQKLAIEEHWNTFIHGLRSFKNLNIDDKVAATKWLVTMQQALDFLIFTHAIISIKVAMDITKEAIKQYPYSAEFMSDIEIYLTQKQQKIIDAEEREKNAEVKKIREKEQRKQLAEAKKQKINDEVERKRNVQNIIDVYKNKEQEWQQLLAQIIQHKTATDQDNIAYTNEATKIAEFLLHPMKPVIVANKRDLGEKLKQEFTNALLQQQKTNEHKINIFQNGIDRFYAEIDKMT